MATRAMLVMALALLGGACGSSSGGAAHDAGGDHTPGSDAAGNYLTGTFTPTGPTNCLTGSLKTVSGEAQCLVTEQFTGADGAVAINVPSCNESAAAPCWALVSSPATCAGGLTFLIQQDTANPPPADVSYAYQCVKS